MDHIHPELSELLQISLIQALEKERILNPIYNNFSADRMRLQGFALNKRMVVLPEFKTAYILPYQR